MGFEPRRFPVIWRKSRYSADQGACVEMGTWSASILVRDSADPAGSILPVTPVHWREFLARIKAPRDNCTE